MSDQIPMPDFLPEFIPVLISSSLHKHGPKIKIKLCHKSIVSEPPQEEPEKELILKPSTQTH